MAKVSLNSYYRTAIDLHKSGRLREARKLYADILKLNPNHLESLFMTGQSWYQEKRFDQALDYFNKGLKQQTGNADFLLQKGKTLIKLNRFDEAKSVFDQLVKSNKNNSQVLFHAARNLKEIGQLSAAIKLYENVLQIDSSHIHALNNLGNLYQQVFDYDKSMSCYNRLIDLNDQVAMAYCNKAGLLQKMGKLDEAESFYHQVLRLEPNNGLALYNLGVIENRRYNFEQALQWIQKSLKSAPDNHKYLTTYATTLCSLGQKKKGASILEKLVKTGTRSEEPYAKLARIFISNHQEDRAIQLLKPYVEKNPYSYEGTYLLGVLCDLDQELEKAEKYLTKVSNHPEFELRANMTLQLLYSKLGRMDKYEEMMNKVTHLLNQFVQGDRQEDEIPIYNLAYYPYDLELVTAVTKKFSQSLIRSVLPLRNRLQFKYPSTNGKMKIGYISPSFKKHPAGVLIQDVLRYHDRERFEIYGYAINCGADKVNQNIRSLVDHYVELDDLQSSDAAKRINSDGIHILVSLAGYNYGMKSEIPALRPAPIQVVGLDYHESMQTDFYDYMFKDQSVLTDENRQFFSESIALLPPSHFFNTALTPSNRKVTREEFGVPEESFVFGALSHPRKLSPKAIKMWIQILKNVSDSVLWLFDGGVKEVQKNIRQFIENEQVDPYRVIFCGRVSQGDHMRRMELMDLFLDTPIYNGHTTCLEALWMEIPVLTMKGKTVSSRLCSSFLDSLNLPGLIVSTDDEYVNKATEIAKNREKAQKLKDYLISQKKTNHFFRPSTLTKRIEAAYMEMWNKYTHKEKLDDLTIS